jgi:hypothetical protein
VTTFSRAVLGVMRLTITIQIIVGITLWIGVWYASLVGVHQIVGMIFVLALWVLSVAALVQRRAVGLALFGLLWGAVVVAFGLNQQRIMPGDLHWVIRVLHLLVGLAAMPIAERLAPSERVARVTA